MAGYNCTTTEPIAVDGATGLIGADDCHIVAVTTAGRGYWIGLYTPKRRGQLRRLFLRSGVVRGGPRDRPAPARGCRRRGAVRDAVAGPPSTISNADHFLQPTILIDARAAFAAARVSQRGSAIVVAPEI